MNDFIKNQMETLVYRMLTIHDQFLDYKMMTSKSLSSTGECVKTSPQAPNMLNTVHEAGLYKTIKMPNIYLLFLALIINAKD